jgi:hypothetical protein
MAVKICEQGQFVGVPAGIIWEKLTQVKQWNEWNPMIRHVELLESPKTDAVGRVFPVTGTSYYFKITDVTAQTTLKWERPYMLGTTLTHSFMLTKNAEGAIVTFEVWVSGIFDRTVRSISRKKLSEDLLIQSRSLKDFCEKAFEQHRIASQMVITGKRAHAS